MPNIQHIAEKDAVLVPVKDWEKLQRELVRLRKKVNKDLVLKDIEDSFRSLASDLSREDYDPANEMTAEQLLVELRNEQ